MMKSLGIRETLQGLLSGSIPPDKAKAQLSRRKAYQPTPIRWPDGSYTMGGQSDLSERQVLELTGVSTIADTVVISFSAGQAKQ